MTRPEKAAALFEQGYSCSQSVLLAFEEVTGLSEELAARLSAPFGGGMGRLREVCGALTGAFMVLGLIYGSADPRDRAAKTALYRMVQELARRFREENGSIICRELLGCSVPSSPVPEARTASYYAKRPCGEMVRCAAALLDATIAAVGR